MNHGGCKIYNLYQIRFYRFLHNRNIKFKCHIGFLINFSYFTLFEKKLIIGIY